MKNRKSLLTAVVASLAVLAAGEARAQTTTTTTTVAPPWVFSKTGNSRPLVRGVTAAKGVKALGFSLTTNNVPPSRVKRMSFTIMGTLQKAEVGNYQLVFYPAGTTAPGVVLGSATGASWAADKDNAIVNIDLVTPFDVAGTFSGLFELRVDVGGTRSFDFQPQLQTVTVESGGVTSYVLATEDLPLLGDDLVVIR